MNYAWDLVIKAEENGIPKEKINFEVAKIYSPYMELSIEDINSKKPEQYVEVNPNYRFYEIFKDMFNINNNEDEEFRNTLFDILIHFLTDIDLKQGMNKKEYYMKFILNDIEDALFGTDLKEKLKIFNNKEKAIISNNILRLYNTGQTLYLLKDTMRKIFKKSIIYVNSDGKDEILFFIGEENTEKNQFKLEFLKEMFLPIKFHTEAYWKNHFGIIGADNIMQIGSIALY